LWWSDGDDVDYGGARFLGCVIVGVKRSLMKFYFDEDLIIFLKIVEL
jgi:hypothetical protein